MLGEYPEFRSQSTAGAGLFAGPHSSSQKLPQGLARGGVGWSLCRSSEPLALVLLQIPAESPLLPPAAATRPRGFFLNSLRPRSVCYANEEQAGEHHPLPPTKKHFRGALYNSEINQLEVPVEKSPRRSQVRNQFAADGAHVQ